MPSAMEEPHCDQRKLWKGGASYFMSLLVSVTSLFKRRNLELGDRQETVKVNPCKRAGRAPRRITVVICRFFEILSAYVSIGGRSLFVVFQTTEALVRWAGTFSASLLGYNTDSATSNTSSYLISHIHARETSKTTDARNHSTGNSSSTEISKSLSFKTRTLKKLAESFSLKTSYKKLRNITDPVSPLTASKRLVRFTFSYTELSRTAKVWIRRYHRHADKMLGIFSAPREGPCMTFSQSSIMWLTAAVQSGTFFKSLSKCKSVWHWFFTRLKNTSLKIFLKGLNLAIDIKRFCGPADPEIGDLPASISLSLRMRRIDILSSAGLRNELVLEVAHSVGRGGGVTKKCWKMFSLHARPIASCALTIAIIQATKLCGTGTKVAFLLMCLSCMFLKNGIFVVVRTETSGESSSATSSFSRTTFSRCVESAKRDLQEIERSRPEISVVFRRQVPFFFDIAAYSIQESSSTEVPDLPEPECEEEAFQESAFSLDQIFEECENEVLVSYKIVTSHYIIHVSRFRPGVLDRVFRGYRFSRVLERRADSAGLSVRSLYLKPLERCHDLDAATMEYINAEERNSVFHGRMSPEIPSFFVLQIPCDAMSHGVRSQCYEVHNLVMTSTREGINWTQASGTTSKTMSFRSDNVTEMDTVMLLKALEVFNKEILRACDIFVDSLIKPDNWVPGRSFFTSRFGAEKRVPPNAEIGENLFLSKAIPVTIRDLHNNEFAPKFAVFDGVSLSQSSMFPTRRVFDVRYRYRQV